MSYLYVWTLGPFSKLTVSYFLDNLQSSHSSTFTFSFYDVVSDY